jgi:hypothetical protein
MARKIKIDNAVLKRRQYKKPEREAKSIVCRILIVCEGEKTEPNYFRAFHKIQRGTFIYDISTDGGGINTMNVVNQAISLRDVARKNGKPYDSVWAVFDRDSFPPAKFDNAIIKAKAHDINCAWSNEAFELWYLLHFQNRISAMGREDYKAAISNAVNASPKCKLKRAYTYLKNDPKNYEIMTKCGDQAMAVRFAESLGTGYTDTKYHSHNPYTAVYKLVRQLIGEDTVFNAMILESMDR